MGEGVRELIGPLLCHFKLLTSEQWKEYSKIKNAWDQEGLDPCAVETAQEEDVLSVACAPYMIGLEYTGVSPVLLGQARILR